ncbi:M48 family peptidase [Candidatus Gracilibacteria bacterium]|nr:MAG: M48 family peptidase [Candidatus Gracilibacteria bacterium]
MKIIRQTRKTLSLSFDKNAELIVKVPKNISDRSINEFLEKHKKWILEKKNLLEKNNQKFEIGDFFLFFGESFELKFYKKRKFFFDGKYFYTNLEKSEDIKKELIKFYKKEAKKYISERILEICKKLKIDFNFLKITSARSRWGSCNSKKNISFSFRLILTPKKSIDYVIVHELAHLSEMNHSKAFWDLVQNYSDQIGIGSYKENKKWLMQNHLKTNF